MISWPLQIPDHQRDVLVEFERLHARWRQASADADAMDCRTYADGPPVERVLRQRLAADCLHRQAMRLLRDTPI